MQEPSNPHDRRAALDRLLDAHGGRLYAIIARLTLRRDVAAELFQELFLRLGRGRGFDGARDPAAYAFRAAINLAMEWRRGRRSASLEASPLSAAAEATASQPSPLQRMVRAEEHQQLLDALSDLNASAREIFVRRFIEQQSYDVIAAILGKTPHQARGLCHAVLRQLRQKLADAHAKASPGVAKPLRTQDHA